MDQSTLIDSVRKGNNHAFEILVNQHKDMVFSICIKITEDYQLAEEAAQDSFLKAYQQIARFKGESKFSSWLYKIALNTSYNKIRSRKPVETLNDTYDEPISSLPDGFDLMHQQDQQKCIKLALAQLDKLDALIISLYYLEDLNIEELVVITELSKSNVKVKLYRARKKMKEAMEVMLSKNKETR